MGSDTDEYFGGDRPGWKPSLQARLQSGMYVCYSHTIFQTEFYYLKREGTPKSFLTESVKKIYIVFLIGHFHPFQSSPFLSLWTVPCISATAEG